MFTDIKAVREEGEIPIHRNEYRAGRKTSYTAEESAQKEMTASFAFFNTNTISGCVR